MLKVYVSRNIKKVLFCVWGNLVRRTLKAEHKNEFWFCDEFIC
jgi:hypothetical protein